MQKHTTREKNIATWSPWIKVITDTVDTAEPLLENSDNDMAMNLIAIKKLCLSDMSGP